MNRVTVWLALNALAFGVAFAAIDVAQAIEASADAASAGPIPAQPSKVLAPLIGEYGVGEELVTVYEAGGRLHATGPHLDDVTLFEDGLREFTAAGTGHDKTRFAFHVDAAGHCDAVSISGAQWPAGTKWPRRDVGAEAVAAIRSGLEADPAVLRTAALAAAPPAEPTPKRPMDLVALSTIDPGLKFDIRYATTNNFMGFPLYEQADAFLQRPAAQALGRVVKSLRSKGYGILVYDAYRPWFVTRMFWDATPPKSRIFVADPAKGSRHNRGCAVDLTLYALRTGQPEEMTSRYDEFSRRAYPDYVGGTSRQRWLRDLLRREMESAGFTVYPEEWWHFDFNGWQDYGIGNETFSELRASADG